MKTIVTGHKENFEVLRKAFQEGNVCLMECEKKDTKEKIAVICAINWDENEEAQMVPFASFFNGNPYEMLNPPSPEGGFNEEEAG